MKYWNVEWMPWLWTSYITEMLGSLASKLSLARLPSCTFHAGATLLPGSRLLPSSLTCLFSTSSLSMADSGGRWWSDRIANKKRRRWYLNMMYQIPYLLMTFECAISHFRSLGYHDQVKQEGPLPRVRDDSARIAGVTLSPSQLNQINMAPLFQ